MKRAIAGEEKASQGRHCGTTNTTGEKNNEERTASKTFGYDISQKRPCPLLAERLVPKEEETQAFQLVGLLLSWFWFCMHYS